MHCGCRANLARAATRSRHSRQKKWPARSLHRAGFAMAYTIPFETDAPAEHCDAAE
jgi:hypothetical protein